MCATTRRRHDRAVTARTRTGQDLSDSSRAGAAGPASARLQGGLPRPVRCDCPDSDGPGSLGPQPRLRCRASARLQGGDMTAPSPQAVRFAAVELIRTGRDLSDRGRAGVTGHQRASKAATRPRTRLGAPNRVTGRPGGRRATRPARGHRGLAGWLTELSAAGQIIESRVETRSGLGLRLGLWPGRPSR